MDLRLALAETTPLRRPLVLLFDSELHCVACYRFGSFARELRAKRAVLGGFALLLHAVWNRWTTRWHHCDISRRADIGPGLRLMHRSGVMVGPAKIGANCLLHHNVTIGERVAGGEHGVPQLGNRVWIGPGATITGGISIGNGATISAGSVLSRDVPDNCLVAGNPGRVVATDYDNSAFLLGIDDDAGGIL